ncbi:Uncharacterised protein [uncultured archaeon]|nr:Uncharacterised protein [uncultured archaeon]
MSLLIIFNRESCVFPRFRSSCSVFTELSVSGFFASVGVADCCGIASLGFAAGMFAFCGASFGRVIGTASFLDAAPSFCAEIFCSASGVFSCGFASATCAASLISFIAGASFFSVLSASFGSILFTNAPIFSLISFSRTMFFSFIEA